MFGIIKQPNEIYMHIYVIYIPVETKLRKQLKNLPKQIKNLPNQIKKTT